MICSISLVLTLLVTFFSLSSLASNNNEQALMDKKLHDKKTKVLIVISSDNRGYWLPEVLEPYHLLQQAGFIPIHIRK